MIIEQFAGIFLLHLGSQIVNHSEKPTTTDETIWLNAYAYFKNEKILKKKSGPMLRNKKTDAANQSTKMWNNIGQTASHPAPRRVAEGFPANHVGGGVVGRRWDDHFRIMGTQQNLRGPGCQFH